MRVDVGTKPKGNGFTRHPKSRFHPLGDGKEERE